MVESAVAIPTARLAARPWLSLAAILSALFLALAAVVSARLLERFDIATSMAVQSIATRTLDVGAFLLTYLAAAEISTLWVLVLAWWLWRRGIGWRALAPTVVFVSLAIEFAGKLLIVQPSVFEEFKRNTLPYALNTLHTGYTFPSGHATRSLIIYGASGWLAVRHLSGWARVALIVATAAFVLVMGLSRVYIGFHWMADVIGAFLLGGACLCVFIHLLDSRIEPTGRR